MAQQRRVFRVAEKIRNTLASELLHLADKRFFLVTITSVVVSPDLRQAKVYWTVTDPDARKAEVEEAFASAEGLLRRSLGKELDVRFMPELRFYYDDTLDTQAHVDELFERIKEQHGDD
jgi:ribosome-binding factor A